MENNLKLLSLSRDFYVSECNGGEYYDISMVSNSKLTAKIYPKANKVEYGMTIGDVYYTEFIEINMNNLNKLREFCELLMKEGNE